MKKVLLVTVLAAVTAVPGDVTLTYVGEDPAVGLMALPCGDAVVVTVEENGRFTFTLLRDGPEVRAPMNGGISAPPDYVILDAFDEYVHLVAGWGGRTEYVRWKLPVHMLACPERLDGFAPSQRGVRIYLPRTSR